MKRPSVNSQIQSRRGGQAMIEYLLVAAAMIVMVTILAVFLYTLRESSGRTLDHVASEYP